MRLRSLASAVLIVAVFFATIVTARADGSKALLSVSVNTVEKGVFLIKVLDDDVLIKADDADALGIGDLTKGKSTAGFISLKGLAANLSYKMDVEKLTLALTVDARFLSTTSVSLQQGSDITVSHAPSAFLNYAASVTSGSRSLSGEFGTTVARGLFYTTFSSSDGRFQHGITTWTKDSPNKMRRVIFGDTFVDAGDLGGSALLEGVTVQRNWGLNPNFIRNVAPKMTGYVSTPSSAEIYVNGMLVGRQDLQPGAFDFSNLPLITGANNAVVVIHDAFGNTQTLRKSFYQGTESLRRGVSDYAFGLGFEKSGNGGRGPATMIGRYSVGVTDRLTAGARIEVARGLLSVGPTMRLTTKVGQFAVALGASRSQNRAGAAGAFSYGYSSRRFSFDTSMQFLSPSYANASLEPSFDRALFEASAGLSFPVFRKQNISFHYSAALDRDKGRTGELALSTSVRLTRHISLSLEMRSGRDQTGTQRGIFAGLNVALPHEIQSSTSLQVGNGQAATAISLARGATPDHPLGVSLSQSRADGQASTAFDMQYEGQNGRYEIMRDSINGQTTTQLNAAGSIAWIGGGFYFAKPIGDSYGLVDANGLKNVRVTANNQDIGRTNRRGKLLIPNLLSYYGNDIAITTSDAPLNYNFKSSKETLTPSYRGGAVAHFSLYRTQSFLGSVSVVRGLKAISPAYGLLTLNLGKGKQATSDLGDKGEFYLENVEPGTYAAVVEYKGGRCAFNVTIPNDAPAYVKLGMLTCIASK